MPAGQSKHVEINARAIIDCACLGPVTLIFINEAPVLSTLRISAVMTRYTRAATTSGAPAANLRPAAEIGGLLISDQTCVQKPQNTSKSVNWWPLAFLILHFSRQPIGYRKLESPVNSSVSPVTSSQNIAAAVFQLRIALHNGCQW